MSSADAIKNLELLQSGKGADLRLKTGGEEFHVHKSIIFPRSDVIAAAENEKDEITLYFLDDDDPPTVSRMIRYLYTGGYDDTETVLSAKNEASDSRQEDERAANQEKLVIADCNMETVNGFDVPVDAEADDTEARMMVHVKVYSLAELLKINDLKTYAQTGFEELAADYWPYDDLPTMIHAVYASTPPWDVGLRGIMIDVCVAHYKELMQAENVLEMMAVHGDLAVEVMREVVQDLQQEIRSLRNQRSAGYSGDLGKGKMVSMRRALDEIQENEEDEADDVKIYIPSSEQELVLDLYGYRE